jgi:hypothetical protein
MVDLLKVGERLTLSGYADPEPSPENSGKV